MKKSFVTGAAVLLLATGGVTSAADAKCDRPAAMSRFRDQLPPSRHHASGSKASALRPTLSVDRDVATHQASHMSFAVLRAWLVSAADATVAP